MGDVLELADRRPPGYTSRPMLIGEIGVGFGQRRRFEMPLTVVSSYLDNWKLSIPAHVKDVLTHCGSAAELSFVAGFAKRCGVGVVDHRTLRLGDTDVRLQSRARGYFVDLMAERGACRLAIEVDGMGFHNRSEEQVEKDYIRERRLTLVGCSVIRFTAREAFGQRDECWRQIDAILERRANA